MSLTEADIGAYSTADQDMRDQPAPGDRWCGNSVRGAHAAAFVVSDLLAFFTALMAAAAFVAMIEAVPLPSLMNVALGEAASDGTASPGWGTFLVLIVVLARLSGCGRYSHHVGFATAAYDVAAAGALALICDLLITTKIYGMPFAAEQGVRWILFACLAITYRAMVAAILSRRSGHSAKSGLKRMFDIVVSALLLMLLSPLMLAIAMMIRIGGGPALYRHKRIGIGGGVFGCIKFRSMDVNADALLAELLARDPSAAAEWSDTQKLRNDPRITGIGRFLRNTSLDELPQLINVLRGEMSLVGPRPIVKSELRFYGENAAYYMQARPGLTGLWQVSGRSDTSYEERITLDVSYVRNWTFGHDLKILLKTLPAVLLRSGAV